MNEQTTSTTIVRDGTKDRETFCLFAGGFYYPEGGAGDFRGFGTVDELKALYAANNKKWSKDAGNSPWGHVCEHATMRIVWIADHGISGINWIGPLMSATVSS